MKKEINIEHNGTPFPKRIRYWASLFGGILFMFLVFFFFDDDLDNLIVKMTIVAVVFGAYIAFRMQHDILYLVDFISDSDKIDIRFYKGYKEIKKKTTFNDIEVVLKNTTTRSGYNCELWLLVSGDKFLIDNTFEWTFEEMKDLLEYVKFVKNKALTESDKFNLSRMMK